MEEVEETNNVERKKQKLGLITFSLTIFVTDEVKERENNKAFQLYNVLQNKPIEYKLIQASKGLCDEIQKHLEMLNREATNLIAHHS